MTSPLHNVRVHSLGLTDDFLLTLSDRAQAASVKDATPKSYDLPPRTSLDEAVLDAWDDARKAWTKYQSHGQDAWNSWLRPLLKTMDYSFTSGGTSTGRYAIRHLSDTGDVPLHVTSAADLDRVNEETGIRVSPHGLMQGYLNMTSEHLWGVVTNGDVLRVLRDNNQVTRPAYLEFRLSDIMNGEDARAFRVMWLLLHRTRLKGGKGSLLEAWNSDASKAGVKARDSLRDGVARAIELVGTGLLQRNPDLRARLSTGDHTPTDLYRACLKLIYQMVFVFVVEDRDLLFARTETGDYVADARTRDRARHYLTRRLRERATGQEGSAQHTDAFDGWQRLVSHLRSGFPALGLPALGSDLFKPTLIEELKLGNQEFLAAVRAMSEIEVDRTVRPVNYAGLDSEELGSIYESLLEFVPQIDAGSTFRLTTLAGNERKTTGSYYTPSDLIELLLESALDPVIEQATSGKSDADAIEALKALKIIDPACGSGHFLIAAARRVGAKLAQVQERTSQPSPDAFRRATRTVIAHCIYGTDINPMAIELAKVALWLESQDAGKPLAFLDHRLRVGNALMGTTDNLLRQKDTIPEQVIKGVVYPAVEAVTLHVPDAAFAVIEGDDRKTVSNLRKRNKQEREQAVKANRGAQTLGFEFSSGLQTVSQMMRDLNRYEPDTISSIEQQEARWEEIQRSEHLNRLKVLSDAWCAAFVTLKTPGSPEITTATLHQLNANVNALPDVREAVAKIAEQYQFFHSFVEFSDVHHQGGFDCVIGNPPWDMVEINDTEFFAVLNPEIATESDSDRRKGMIGELEHGKPDIYRAYRQKLRELEGFRHFVQASGRYPLSSIGRINLYPIFQEISISISSPNGSIAQILPTAIATSVYNAELFSKLINNSWVAIFIDFINTKGIFPAVDSRFRFSLLSVSKAKKEESLFAFMQTSALEARNNLTPITREELAVISPLTLAPPMVQTIKDKQLLLSAIKLAGLFLSKDGWNPEIRRMHSLSDGKGLFTKKPIGDGWLPLYAGKTIHHYNHRYSTFRNGKWQDLKPIELADTGRVIETAYFVLEEHHEKRTISKRPYIIGYRDITNSTNERTAISAIIPNVACDTTLRNIYTSRENDYLIVANLNSFVFDYFCRLKVADTHLNATTLLQLPVLPPDAYSPHTVEFIKTRIIELTFTSEALNGFAIGMGFSGDPYVWNEERRFALRCELDALFFILYGIERSDVEYIMETFPTVKKREIAAHNRYRAKEEILGIYDRLAQLGLTNLEHYVSHWGVTATPTLGPEAENDEPFRQAILNQAIAYTYITKPFHQTRVYNQRTFQPRLSVKDWEDAIADSEP